MKLSLNIVGKTPDVIADALEKIVQDIRDQTMEHNCMSFDLDKDDDPLDLDWCWSNGTDPSPLAQGEKVIHPFNSPANIKLFDGDKEKS